MAGKRAINERVNTALDYLPITVEMKGKPCLIIGGGNIAGKKLKHLLTVQAQVFMLSEWFSGEIEKLAQENDIKLISRDLSQAGFCESFLNDMYLVVAATEDKALNSRISKVAKLKGLWVNVVDDMALSTFILPANTQRLPLLVTVSSSAVAWLFVRDIGRKIERVVSLIWTRFIQK